MHSDAHLHLVDLEERDLDFASGLRGQDWVGAVVSHDRVEFERSETLRATLPPTVAGFGIHPQAPRWDTADYLAGLARSGRISFIGEAGFDFFGDRPERVRDEANLREQARCFEFQLELAREAGLPLLIHTRKATDLLLGYSRRLSTLPAVVFHGWPGRLEEAQAFLSRGVRAFFSFGTPLLRGARHALESLSALPLESLLSETDAPWQPPKGHPWTDVSLVEGVARAMAAARNTPLDEFEKTLRDNFESAFGEGEKP